MRISAATAPMNGPKLAAPALRAASMRTCASGGRWPRSCDGRLEREIEEPSALGTAVGPPPGASERRVRGSRAGRERPRRPSRPGARAARPSRDEAIERDKRAVPPPASSPMPVYASARVGEGGRGAEIGRRHGPAGASRMTTARARISRRGAPATEEIDGDESVEHLEHKADGIRRACGRWRANSPPPGTPRVGRPPSACGEIGA